MRAIGLFIVTQVLKVPCRFRVPVGYRKFERFRTTGSCFRHVKNFELEYGRVTPPVKLLAEEHLIVAGHQQQCRSIMNRTGGDKVHQIIVLTRQVPDVVDDMLDENLLLLQTQRSIAAARTINGHGFVYTTKKLHRIEADIKAEIIVFRSAGTRTFQPHPRVVEDFAFVVDDGRAQPVIRHSIGDCVEQITVRFRHKDAEIVPLVSRCLAVLHLIKCSGIRTGRWKHRGSTSVIRPCHVELHNGRCFLSRNRGLILSSTHFHHRCTLKHTLDDRVEQRHPVDAIGIVRHGRNDNILIRIGHDRTVRKIFVSRADVVHLHRIDHTRRSGLFRSFQQSSPL